MNLVSCICDPRKNNYVRYHSTLLVFTIIAIIPINLHLTRFSFPITTMLFTIGFFSLFMIARNEKVGRGLLNFLRIKPETKKYHEHLQYVNTYNDSDISEKIQYAAYNNASNYEEPISLLKNFIDELTRRHEERMDWTTLDSFRKLSARVEKLRVQINDA